MPSEGRVLRQRLAELLGKPNWRDMIAAVEPVPWPAKWTSPALAHDVIMTSGVASGTPVHVMKSYLAPLGLAVADALDSPWVSLDLDDDDEALALALGNPDAAAYRRIVSTFAGCFSAVCLASANEATIINRRHGLRAVPVANSITVPTFKAYQSRGTSLLFVGNLTYQPNIDAAVTLVEQVQPAITARLGEVTPVVLAGNFDPEGPISNLVSRPHVEVLGFVPDLAPLYAQSAVVVVPLHAGAGTRIKLLEAFAHCVPVVTTPPGAAGLEVRDHDQILIGTTPQELADAVCEVLQSTDLAHSLTTAAYDFVTRTHSTSVVSNQILQFFELARTVGRISERVPLE